MVGQRHIDQRRCVRRPAAREPPGEHPKAEPGCRQHDGADKQQQLFRAATGASDGPEYSRQQVRQWRIKIEIGATGAEPEIFEPARIWVARRHLAGKRLDPDYVVGVVVAPRHASHQRRQQEQQRARCDQKKIRGQRKLP